MSILNQLNRMTDDADLLLAKLPTSRMRDACSIVHGYVSLYPDFARGVFPWGYLGSMLEFMRTITKSDDPNCPLPTLHDYEIATHHLPYLLPRFVDGVPVIPRPPHAEAA